MFASALSPSARQWAAVALFALATFLQGFGLSANAPLSGSMAGGGTTPTALLLSATTEETETA